VTFTNSPRGAEEKTSAVRQWEYHQITAPRTEDELNKLGGEGWEMCGVLPFKDGGGMIYFKRSKQNADAAAAVEALRLEALKHQALSTAAEDPKKQPDQTSKDIEGSWQRISTVAPSGGGSDKSREVWEIKDGTMKFTTRVQAYEFDYHLDPTKSPKQIDMILSGGRPDAGLTFKGIYKVDDAVLTICFVPPAKAEEAGRPKDFITTKDEMSANRDFVQHTFERPRPPK
jgi:uncharacterized protein (TIGR03067 family)